MRVVAKREHDARMTHVIDQRMTHILLYTLSVCAVVPCANLDPHFATSLPLLTLTAATSLPRSHGENSGAANYKIAEIMRMWT